MNKIFRKCRDFGIMIDISSVEYDRSLECVKSLKESNIPLCVIDKSKVENWSELLRNIAFNEDLFIAVENIESIEEAYIAAGNGAQFFIFNKFDINLYKELTSNGFFYIPYISSKSEEDEIINLGIEVSNCKEYTIVQTDKIYSIKRDSLDNVSSKLKENEIFKIVSLTSDTTDYSSWGNELLKSFLALEYKVVELSTDATEEVVTFGKLFAATNRCSLVYGSSNSLTLTCKDFIKTVNYLKWRELYIDPLNVIKNDKGLYSGILDTKLQNFTIKIEEIYEY